MSAHMPTNSSPKNSLRSPTCVPKLRNWAMTCCGKARLNNANIPRFSRGRQREVCSDRQDWSTNIHGLLSESVVQAVTQNSPDQCVIDRPDSPVASMDFFGPCKGWPTGHKSEQEYV